LKHSALRVAAILGLAVSCNDGGGGGVVGGDVVAPSVAIAFPPPTSATEAGAITVSGTASDPSGVAEVRVNGVLASTGDGFATWQASVPLLPGTNTLTVTAGDTRGNSDAHAAGAEIESQAFLFGPSGIVTDPLGQRALVLDRERVLTVDLVNGVRTILSDESHGAGPSFSNSFSIALDGNRALVVERGFPAAVLAVDLTTGDRSILSDNSHGAGEDLGALLAIVVDGNRALVTSDIDSGGQLSFALIAVDLTSGDRTFVSKTGVGDGLAPSCPEGMALDGGRALVVDRCRRALMAVDFASGDRSILSDENNGLGPLFNQPRGIVLDGGRALVADESYSGILAVDLASGDRVIFSDAATGTGPALSRPSALSLDGDRALVGNAFGGVLALDLASGERSFVSPPMLVGAGVGFQFPEEVAVVDGRALVVAGSRIYEVDLASGDRTILTDASFSTPVGTGPALGSLDGIVVNGERALVTANGFHVAGVYAVDLSSGDRTIVSDLSTGTGPVFLHVSGIALDGGRAFVTADAIGGAGVFAVDLSSGNRTVVSDASTGTGPQMSAASGLVLDGQRALVVGFVAPCLSSGILAVDLSNGDRTLVSDCTTGSGPEFSDPSSLVLDGGRVLLSGRGPLGSALFAVDLASGERTILSDSSTGAGVFASFGGLALAGDQVIAASQVLQALVAVDPRSGDRVIASR